MMAVLYAVAALLGAILSASAFASSGRKGVVNEGWGEDSFTLGLLWLALCVGNLVNLIGALTK